jgi:ParB-like nuclease domain
MHPSKRNPVAADDRAPKQFCSAAGTNSDDSPAPAPLRLAAIRIDGGTQGRASLREDVVNDCVEAIRGGATFPPVVVFHDGESYWLADGSHRHAAYSVLGFDTIDADIRQGTCRNAILFSVGANETHGLRRTIEDKRRAVLILLNDEEWSGWSDREIARQCAVSQPFVSKLRLSVTDNVISKRVYQTKHGTVTTMDTSGIGSGSLPDGDSDAARYMPLYVAARWALMEAAAGIGRGSIEDDLALFDAARTALGEARRVDEVADIPEKAVRMRMYTLQAKDTALVGAAVEIQLRMERRLGNMLAASNKAETRLADASGGGGQ